MERTLHLLQQTLGVIKVKSGICVEGSGAHYERLRSEAMFWRAYGSLENLVNYFLKRAPLLLGSLPELLHQVILDGEYDSFCHAKMLGLES